MQQTYRAAVATGQAGAGRRLIDPEATAAIVAQLRRDGRNRHVTDELIARRLDLVPVASLNPLLMLRRFRDETSVCRLPPPALRRVADLARRSPPASWSVSSWSPLLVSVTADLPWQRIAPGDPSFAAWVSEYRRRGLASTLPAIEARGGFRELTIWPPRHRSFAMECRT